MHKENWKKTVFIIYAGQAFSILSSSVVQFALLWYLTDVTGSAIILAVAAFAGYLPQGILSVFFGVYVDRYDRKKIMVLSDLGIAFASLILVISGLFQELPIWLILSMMFLRSIGTAFHTPALQALVPHIVPEDKLVKTAGFTQSLSSVSLLISPAIAAILYSFWSLSSIIFLDVIGALLACLALLIAKTPAIERKKSMAAPKVLYEIKAAFMVLKNNKGVMGAMFIGSIFFLVFSSINALFSLMVMGYFGGSTAQAGIAETAFALGMFVGFMTLGIWGGFKNKIKTIIMSFLIMGTALVVAGQLPSTAFVWFVVTAGLMGLSSPFYMGVHVSIYQEKISSEFLGRIMSLSLSVTTIAGLLGVGIGGLLADGFGVETWFLIGGILMLISGCLFVVFPSVRNCDRRLTTDQFGSAEKESTQKAAKIKP